jgi:hypothetical protein
VGVGWSAEGGVVEPSVLAGGEESAGPGGAAVPHARRRATLNASSPKGQRRQLG